MKDKPEVRDSTPDHMRQATRRRAEIIVRVLAAIIAALSILSLLAATVAHLS